LDLAPRMNDEWIARADADDARHFNSIGNDPAVIYWIAGPLKPPLDLTSVLEDPANYCLLGRHGWAVFHRVAPSVYEWHAAVRPEGHGRWALNAARQSLDWLFCHSDAVAVIAPVPQHNRGARCIVRALGFALHKVLPSAWPTGDEGRAVSVHVYLMLRSVWGGQYQ
jgi:hypothetical protein